VIAVVLIVVVLYVAIHSNLPEEVFFRWFGLAVATAITFGYPLAWYRRLWHNSLFWIRWAALLALHLAIYTSILLSVAHFGYLWFAIITPLEWSVICPILQTTVKRD
jgi:hypothetical protein